MDSSLYALAILCLILPLLVGAIYLLKKFMLKLPSGNQHIQIASQLNIGAKEKILLIEAGQKTFLIGATPESINTLHVFNDDALFTPEKNKTLEKTKKPLWGRNTSV